VLYFGRILDSAEKLKKFLLSYVYIHPRWYPYFDVVVGLAWSYDPESYAGRSVAAGWVSHDGEIKGDDPDKKGTLAI
jgi:hypothetical protein